MVKRFFLVALFALAPLLADDRGPLNRNIPSWVTFGAQARVRAEGQHGIGFEKGNNQDFLLSRYRFSTLLRPKSWLQFYGKAIISMERMPLWGRSSRSRRSSRTIYTA